MEDRFKILADFLGRDRVKRNEDLSSYLLTGKKIVASTFYIATNIHELKQVLNLAHELKLPFKILGGGTKITFSRPQYSGLVIKNRTSSIKIAGIKGKVGRVGLGVEEALIEVDSGVSLGRLNEYLKENNFLQISGIRFHQSSIGSLIFDNFALKTLAQKITLWSAGESWEARLDELEKKEQIVLTVTFKFKAV